MKILLATGIYPPEIGGPSTYVYELAKALSELGESITVVTYGVRGHSTFHIPHSKHTWSMIRVSRAGGPLLRWWRYSRALRKHATDADAVIAFSSVSCGVPLWMAKLQKPKKILRLGGDFLWERYTDHGGKKTLREFYEDRLLVYSFIRLFVERLLRSFDHIVFSTRFQEELYERHYRDLPLHSVIENPLLAPSSQLPAHVRHTPFRLLFMGRFVGFKNLPALLEAVSGERLAGSVTLTMVGEGPLRSQLTALSSQLGATVHFLSPLHGEEKQQIFADHDLLVLPSLTEISPNVALEARAAGLPVLLTEETGLSEKLRQGMMVRDLSTSGQIADALAEVMRGYSAIVAESAMPPSERGWDHVAEEYLRLCRAKFLLH